MPHYQVVLLGPQVSTCRRELAGRAAPHGVPVATIDMIDLACSGATKVLDHAFVADRLTCLISTRNSP